MQQPTIYPTRPDSQVRPQVTKVKGSGIASLTTQGDVFDVSCLLTSVVPDTNPF